MATKGNGKSLKKNLKLFDVYAVATGAMFSSGFFLLPGLAAMETGPSVFLAYFLSGIAVLPTMFAVAELSPAMPKAGGTYYIIDRALGPLMGTIGGYGSWLALILKSAFALIGMGAYIAIFWEVNITAVAIILTIAFGAINLIGAKETAIFQRILVSAIVVVMAFYIVQGLAEMFSLGILDIKNERFTPFLTDGTRGFFATVGMVFVSYAGLTKVASIAEEVKNPDRNIPLGMFLSIITAIVVYTVGVFIIVSFLEPSVLRDDLTPVATAGEEFLGFLPGSLGIILVVIAAVSAFASTGNAGILSASRYPFAMSRDKLIGRKFNKIGKRGTPTLAVISTVLLMILVLVLFDVEEVAKLASAFQLLLFFLLNLAVIVMRESRIEGYDPAFKTPLYPWVPILGMIITSYLIFEIGFISIFFTLVVSAFAVGWYYYYGHRRIEREGAVFHIYERLGQRKDSGLDQEMAGIVREKGLRDGDPYEEVIGRSSVLDLEAEKSNFDEILQKVSEMFAEKLKFDQEDIYNSFKEKTGLGTIPIGQGAVLKHIRVDDDIKPEMVMVRVKNGADIDKKEIETTRNEDASLNDNFYALLLLIGSEDHASQHLRFLAHIVEMIEQQDFKQRWLQAENKEKLRQILLRDERFITLTIKRNDKTEQFINKKVKDIDLPEESLISIIERNDDIKIPHGITTLKENDRLLIVGKEESIEELKKLQE